MIDRPWLTLVVTIIVTTCFALGGLFLTIEFSPDQVYVGRDGEVEFSEDHKRQFRFEDSIVLVVLQDTSEQSLIRPDCLACVDNSQTLLKNCLPSKT